MRVLFTLIAAAGAALLLAGAGGADAADDARSVVAVGHLRRLGRPWQVRRRRGRVVLLRATPVRSERQQDDGQLGPGQAARDPREGVLRPLDPVGDRAGSPSLLRHPHRQGARDHELAAHDRPVRRVAAARRAHVSAGDRVRRRQRAEPDALLAAAVRPSRPWRVGDRVRVVPRALVRRAQGGQPGDHGRRRRAVAARQRHAAREEQHLDLAGEVHPRSRDRLPAIASRQADHGRLRLPSVSGARPRLARQGLPVAERRRCEPRPDQAGPLGRVPRDRPADRRGRARRRAAASAARHRRRRHRLHLRHRFRSRSRR